MGVANGDKSAKQRAQALELSHRGTEIAEMALSGMTWTAIGKELGVAPNTARNHVIRANKALLQKREDLAEQLLSKMQVDIYEQLAFNMSIIANVQVELEKERGKESVSLDKIIKHEKRALLTEDRNDRLYHRLASLSGLAETTRTGGAVIGVASITINLGGAPPPAPAPTEQALTVEGTLVHSDDSE